MIYFPAFLNLEDQPVLICGGGRHALEKIQRLRPFHPRLTLIAPEICPEILAEPDLVILHRAFTEDDARSLPRMVVTAEAAAENKRIADLCRRYRVLVNAVDQQADCDFIFPAIVAREPICVGVSSAGVSPSAAVEIREKVQEFLPENTAEILDWLSRVRPLVFGRVPDSSLRRRIMRRLVQEAFALNAPLSSEETEQILNSAAENTLTFE